MLKVLTLSYLILFLSTEVFAHGGSHGNDDCLITVDNVELRLNGYQFKGKGKSDKHYCRQYPYLGKIILKFDSVKADLTGMGLELQLLKRKSWVGLLLNNKDAFSVIKTLPVQQFSSQVVSINSDIQTRDVYALNLRLHRADGTVKERLFTFFVGIPFAMILVIISLLLLLFISVIFLKQLKKY